MSDPLTRWLEANAPDLAKSFAPPVDPAHVEEAVKAWGDVLPEAYVSFLRAHDGQRWIQGEKSGVGTLAPIFTSFEILGVRHALGEHRSMREWGDDSADLYFPFTTIGGESTHHAFDREGRVFVVSMKGPRRELIAESFDAFVARLVAILEEGATIEEEGIDLGDDALDWLAGEP
jgi:hypothetical protein